MKKAFCVFVLFLLAGCVSVTKMTVVPLPRPTPDVAINSPVLSSIRSIAVLPFEDSDKIRRTALPSPPFPKGTIKQRYPYTHDGEVIADGITTYLAKSFQFKMIDRKNVKELLQEQAFQVSGVVNESKAVQVGKLVGADAILFGKVNSCLLDKQWKYKGKSYITQEIAILNVDFKLIHVESGEVAVIAHHELTTQHLMNAPVEMVNTKIVENPNYYTSRTPGLDQVIKSLLDETLQPVINAKRSSTVK